jgi:hypothetical protein
VSSALGLLGLLGLLLLLPLLLYAWTPAPPPPRSLCTPPPFAPRLRSSSPWPPLPLPSYADEKLQPGLLRIKIGALASYLNESLRHLPRCQ